MDLSFFASQMGNFRSTIHVLDCASKTPRLLSNFMGLLLIQVIFRKWAGVVFSAMCQNDAVQFVKNPFLKRWIPRSQIRSAQEHLRSSLLLPQE